MVDFAEDVDLGSDPRLDLAFAPGSGLAVPLVVVVGIVVKSDGFFHIVVCVSGELVRLGLVEPAVGRPSSAGRGEGCVAVES